MSDEALPEQSDFIELAPNQSAVLAAGPGTGKTWVLERRSAFLVDAGVDSAAIATLTLTRSLAQQLSQRIPHGRASTLHSFELAHLNRLGDAWGKRVVDPWEQEEIVRRDLALGHRIAFGDRPHLSHVNRFLKKMSTAFRENQAEPADLNPLETQLRQVFQQHRILFGYRLLDELAYDLIRLIEGGHRLETVPSHILVDEYQDLTAGELRLLQLLHDEFDSTVNACGDDRQSIYGFREADPLALHRFPEVYDSGAPRYLWRSRRCPANICTLANAIAAALPPLPGLERPGLEPWPGREDAGTVELLSFPSPIAEARGVIERCNALLAAGTPEQDVVIVVARFYDPVMAKLRQAADEDGVVRVYDPRSTSSIASTAAIRLLVASLRLIVNAEDQMAWRRLVYETPGFTEARLEAVLEEDGATFAARLRRRAETDQVAATTVSAATRLIETFEESPEIALEEVIALAAESLGIGGVDLAPLEELRDDKPRDPAGWIQRVFEQSELEGEDEGVEQKAGIAVHTIFSAKGLEAPFVFLVNALNESFAGQGDVADGVRQAYVAVTRASHGLTITAPRSFRYQQLANYVGADVGALAEMLVDAAGTLGVQQQILQ